MKILSKYLLSLALLVFFSSATALAKNPPLKSLPPIQRNQSPQKVLNSQKQEILKPIQSTIAPKVKPSKKLDLTPAQKRAETRRARSLARKNIRLLQKQIISPKKQ